MRTALTSAKRIVVKIGSAILARDGVLDPGAVARLAGDIGAAAGRDRRAVVVTSGAVASGFRGLGLTAPPKAISQKQAAAAVGQPLLMNAWSRAFEPRTVAQVLLTAADLDHRLRFLNARHTLETLLEAGAVPIINENDSVSFEEIKLGDNDHLSAMIANLVSADALIILSSAPGLLEGLGVRGRSPTIIPRVDDPEAALRHVVAEKTATGVGGMETKLRAAAAARAMGVATVIADGRLEGVVQRVLAGEEIGTLVTPVSRAAAARARKRWIGFSARPKGAIVVDDGAEKALRGRGASLLPGGVVSVAGEFDSGDPVEIRARRGEPFARGLASYSSAELERIKGLRSGKIAAVLGYCYADEVVHRNDLVLLSGGARAG